MASATQHRPNTSTPGDGSRTITILDSNPREDSSGEDHPSGPSSVALLRLRGGPRRTRQRVAWDEDVVDNEGAGKKKSKSLFAISQKYIITHLICLFFHLLSLLYLPQT